MTQQLEQTTAFTPETVEAFGRGEPDWARDRRLEAWRVYEDTPMPARTDEEWRRTDISSLRLDSFDPGAEGAGIQPLQSDLSGAVVQSAASARSTICAEARDQGAIFTSLEEAVRDHPRLVELYLLRQGVLPSHSKFAALNAAFWRGGTLLYVPRGVTVGLPFASVRNLPAAGAATLPRTLIILEAGSSATYLELQQGPGATSPVILSEAKRRPEPVEGNLEGGPGRNPPAGLHCGVTDIFLNDGAELRYFSLQEWGQGVWDFSITRASLGRNSRLRSLSIGLGARSSRVHLDAVLEGDGAEAQLRGIYCGNSRQHFEYRTLQDHAAPHTGSDLLYKGALKDRANAAYLGTVRVQPGGSHSTSNQANHNLLLNPGAKADSLPILEILAKDIERCSHGATAGQVDEEQLFYLMCRGLGRAEAYELIVAGFFEPVVKLAPLPELQEHLWNAISQKLAFHYVEHTEDISA